MLTKLAFRNLMRRPVQSTISVLALAVGLTLTVFMINFQVGMWDVIVNTSVKAISGHIVVQGEGFQESQDADLLVAESTAIADELRRVAPDAVVLRRTTMAGLLQSPNNNVGVGISGVEPDAEAQVNSIADRVIEGTWLLPEDTKHLVIGTKLARKLDVELGDKVVLMVGVNGDYESKPLRVRGIFETGSRQIDGFLVMVPLATMQGMLPTIDDPASQVSVLLDGRTEHRALIGPARAALAERPVEVLSWEEAMPDLKKSREMDISFAFVIWPVMALVVSIGVLNTLLMSLFERTRELGVMLAVGMKPRDLFKLLLMEGFILGMVGAGLGLIGGLLLTWPAATMGFTMPGMEDAAPVSNVAFDGVFYANFEPLWDIGWALFFVFLSTVVSAYPAWQAATTDPVTSMRQQ